MRRMTVPAIISLVMAALERMGLTPYIQAGLFIVVAISTIAAIRELRS